MVRLLPALLALALLLTPALAHAQLWTPSGEPWFSEIQDIGVIGSYGVLVPNEGTTGTTNNLLACYAAGGLAITCLSASTGLEVLGPVQRNGGTTGSALIANSGIAPCQFDGATTAGNYVQKSVAVNGNCADVGATYPTNLRRVLGTVTTTNGASGVYPVFLYARGIVSAPEVTAGTGSAGYIAYYSTPTLLGAFGATANTPILGGNPPVSGTRSGNTTAYVTTTGTQTSGNYVKIDANGNHIASGSAFNAETWAVVTADVTHAQSSTTLTDVTGLSVAVCAASTEVWQFEVNLLLTQTATAADWKWGWTFPTGVTMAWGTTSAAPTEDHWGNTGIGASPIVVRVQTDTLLSGSANLTHVFHFKGFAFCSSTAGTLQLQFAQNTSGATDNVVKKGSMATFRKVIP